MKTPRKQFAEEQASVLMVSMLICAILGILMGSYLMMARTQRFSVARAQSWNQAMVVAEAGVEEALAHLNTAGVTTNKLAVNGWINLSGGRYAKTNTLGTSSYGVTIVVTNNLPPLVVSRGYVPGPVATPTLVRTVQIRTKPKPSQSYPAAMVVISTMDLNGSGIATDSFDSSNTNYSTGGTYDPKKALDHGDIQSLSGATNAIQVDNGKIKGTVHTAPGGVAQVGPGGTVGDMNWVNSGNEGIQAGHFKDDVNASFPDAVLPPVAYWLQPVPGNYKINGTTYKYVLNNSSPWTLKTLANSVYVSGKDTILYVQDDIAIGSRMEIRIAPGASLKVYMAGAKASISGSGVINETGQAKNFSYFGLPTNTYLDMGANASFVGTIYAPQAAYSLGGGGRNTYDFVGASITFSAKMNGHYNFHYDEDLKHGVTSSGYLATSWDEL